MVFRSFGEKNVSIERKTFKISRLRQVMFTNTKKGMLRKGYKLSTLCDAEVDLIIFFKHANVVFCSR